MKEKLQDKVRDARKVLCIIGGVTVTAGVGFAAWKLCPKHKGRKEKKK